jgi:hypothetical protein
MTSGRLSGGRVLGIIHFLLGLHTKAQPQVQFNDAAQPQEVSNTLTRILRAMIKT